MNRIIFVGYKENDVNNSRIKIGRILTATLMVACLVIISIATSGCVMQVDETEDFDAIELELAEATETDVKFAQEPLACVRDINDNCMQLVDEPGQITMHESIIEVDPTKLPPARTLQVGVDHSAATIKVYDTDMYIVAEMKAADCPVPHTLVIQIDVF